MSPVFDQNPRWYVVQAQPNGEFRAQIQLTAQHFRTFLPVVWKTTKHARQFRTAKAPFFPGYLFVELAMGRDRWRSVNGTFGVSSLIMEGDRPKPVPPGVVEELMAVSDERGLISLDGRLEVDQRVTVLSGPFAGCVGTMTKLTSSGRIQVLLEIMGSRVSLSAKRMDLAPAA